LGVSSGGPGSEGPAEAEGEDDAGDSKDEKAEKVEEKI
jgi:hypothetical protein